MTIGLAGLLRKLIAEGVPELCDCKRGEGMAWDKSTLRNLIRGRQVRGEQPIGRYDAEHRRVLAGETSQAYPAAVTEDQWQEASAALDQRKRGTGTGRNVTKMTKMFGDLARCILCGGRMGIWQKGKFHTYHKHTTNSTRI